MLPKKKYGFNMKNSPGVGRVAEPAIRFELFAGCRWPAAAAAAAHGCSTERVQIAIARVADYRMSLGSYSVVPRARLPKAVDRAFRVCVDT